MRIPDLRKRFRCQSCSGDHLHRPIASGAIEEASGASRDRRRTAEIMQCEACGEVSLCISHWEDPPSMTGDPHVDHLEHHPPLHFREKPDWYKSLPEDYSRVLDEVYVALDHGLFTLASTGVRTALDRLLVDHVGDTGGFPSKIKKLVERQVVTSSQQELLVSVIDAGSASAHRGFVPDAELITSIMEIAEHIFHRVCVAESQERDLIEKAKKLKEATPDRQ